MLTTDHWLFSVLASTASRQKTAAMHCVIISLKSLRRPRRLPLTAVHLFVTVLVVILLQCAFCNSSTRAQTGPKVEIVMQLGHASHFGIRFSPDASLMITNGDGIIKVWDVASGRLLKHWKPHDHDSMALAVSQNGELLLSGANDFVKLWNLRTGELIRSIRAHSGSIAFVGFSSDNTRLFSGGTWDTLLKAWSAATGQLEWSTKAHPAQLNSAAISADGKILVSGGNEQDLKIWDAATGKLSSVIRPAHSGVVLSISMTPDGARIATIGLHGDTNAKVWATSSLKLLQTFNRASDGVGITLSPDGKTLAMYFSPTLMGERGKIQLWDVQTGRLAHTLVGPKPDDGAGVAAFSPDGRTLATGATDIALWDVASGVFVRELTGRALRMHSSAITSDGKWLLAGSASGLFVWDAASGQFTRRIDVRSQFFPLAVSPVDGTLISADDGGALLFWSTSNGRLIRSFPTNAKEVIAYDGKPTRTPSVASFSNDGKLVVTGGWDGSVKLWEALSGRLIRSIDAHSDRINAAIFSFDDQIVLTHSESSDKDIGTLKLWHTGSGQSARAIKVYSGQYARLGCAAFLPNGMHIVTAGSDGTEDSLKLWEMATGQLVWTASFGGWLSKCAVSPDGRFIASGGQDGNMKLWDAVNGKRIRDFEGHTGIIDAISFSPDGKRILSSSQDGTLRLWSVDGSVLGIFACDKAGGCLTITTAGFFTTSGRGLEMLSLSRGLQSVTVDQVHQSLFNPDLVRETLAGDPKGEARQAASVVNLGNVLESGPAPAVAILSPPMTRHAEVVDIVTRVTDLGKGVGRVEWRINGVTAAVLPKPPGVGPAHVLSRQLALDPGDNTVEVVAYNASNLLASAPARTTLKFSGPAHKVKPKLHVLAIGINKYIDQGTPGNNADVFLPLALAAKDAAAFTKDMTLAGKAMYADVRVTLVIDEDATRDKIDRVIQRLAGEVHPRDAFILFAAGHGISHNGRFYFIPQDYSGGGNPASLAQHAIDQDRLQEWLANRIKAKKAIIILDTCESGALVAGHTRSRIGSPGSEAAVGRLHEATGRPVLTAAAVGEFAYEGLISRSGNRHGLFTWALLDALRNGDTNSNGTIELSELVAHVQTLVPKLAAELGGTGRTAIGIRGSTALYKQTARFGSRGEDFALVHRLR